MGVIKLMNFIESKCPSIINHYPALHYKNKTLTIDSPSAIYKFLIKTITSSNSKLSIPMDSQGNQTGHLIGIMYRALLCIEVGIKPIWVFDGTPPTEKLSQLKRRKNLKETAETKSEEALDLGDLIQAAKQSKRSVKISKQEIQDTITMLNLMGKLTLISGMPTVRSYGEAEAQCAWLTKNNFADGVISEDLDTLAFGAKSLVRDFARDKPAIEIPIDKLLNKIQLTQDEFIDFCILCGCDYTPKISRIGPITAYKMIKEEKSIEKVVEKIINDDKLRKKYEVPDDFNFLRARQLFKTPLVNEELTKQKLEQKQIDFQGLKAFLITKQFSENRISRWIDIAKEARQKMQLAK